MRILVQSLALLFLSTLIGGCSGDEPPSDEPLESGEEENPALYLPSVAREEAPPVFRARFETSEGDFLIEARREWAPRGVDRLYNLIRVGFYEDAAFFRAIEDFIAQFGVHSDPEVHQLWSEATIRDDPRVESNTRGTLSFAQQGPDGRSTQLFINLSDNTELDPHFVPVARVVEGMDVVESLYTGYGELYPEGKGPRHQLLNLQGNRYLEAQFPEMDYIEEVEILEGE